MDSSGSQLFERDAGQFPRSRQTDIAKPGRRRPDAVSDSEPIGCAGAPSPRPTMAMMREAAYRNCAPRSITAWVCGDPAPGRSALDAKMLSPN